MKTRIGIYVEKQTKQGGITTWEPVIDLGGTGSADELMALDSEYVVAILRELIKKLGGEDGTPVTINPPFKPYTPTTPWTTYSSGGNL